MKLDQFQAIAKAISIVGHRKNGKAISAAALVLVKGERPSEACRLSGADPGALSRLLKVFDRYKVCKFCKRAHLK